MERYAGQFKKSIPRIDPEALQFLCAYKWPGNVRELQNAVERSVVLARAEGITVDVLPPIVTDAPTPERALRRPYALPLADAVVAFERSYIEHTLSEAKGNVAEAARAADVDRSNYRRLLKRHGIDPVEFSDAKSRRPGPQSD